ncbi:MAG: nuclear transport factor 2 family protein [Saprospiraceae bacterium]|nr:nuclear transport factor 2 family protein [Saprospiraceae bacterium]
MPKRIIFFILIFCFQDLSGQDKERDIATIKTLRKASNESISKRDADGMSRFYAEDFVLIRGNGSQLTGKDNMVTTWQEMFMTNPDVSFERNPTEFKIHDQNLMAWETGTWIGINTYSKGGNYSAMWRKMGGEWKLQAELFVALK